MDPIFAPGLFADQVAVITGGATGIGLEVARQMGGLGARVALCGRRADVLEGAVASLGGESIDAFAAPCDIREPDAIAAFVDAVLNRFGQIDVLVNNAGGQFPIAAEALTPKGFAAVVRNNLLGTWNMTHAVATKALLPRGQGRVVNVVAEVSRGFPGMVHTGAARAGVINLTMTLAVEWARRGIRVNAVSPGVIKTSGTAQYPPMLLERAESITPTGRLGTAEEVAHLITYLGSVAADYITGQNFTIDGGASLWGDLWPLDGIFESTTTAS
jgi:citronellol/citronellal dehydrogenase